MKFSSLTTTYTLHKTVLYCGNGEVKQIGCRVLDALNGTEQNVKQPYIVGMVHRTKKIRFRASDALNRTKQNVRIQMHSMMSIHKVLTGFLTL